MIIERVELKNIKSYKNEVVEFTEGITSISGLNGAGKSTILEAVGFALFDSIPYSQADFVRKGEKTGEVSVTFIGADGLRYTVTRKCGASQSYYLIDSFNNRFEGKEDVGSKLCEILGYRVSSMSQLCSLFENAIGVLQGTFVSEFSKKPGERKKIFAPLLRVEEYDDAFRNLLPLVNMMEARIGKMSEEIRYKEGVASRLDGLVEEMNGLIKDIERLGFDLQSKNEELGIVKAKKDGMDKLEDEAKGLEGQLRLIDVDIQNKRAALAKAESELKKCESAAKKIIETEPGYKEYLAKLDERMSIDAKRDDYNRLVLSYKTLEARLEADRKRLEDYKRSLQELERYEAEIEALRPKVEQEEDLQKKKEEVMASLQEKESERKQLTERMDIVKKSKGNLCPLLPGVECKSVTDFSGYFKERLEHLNLEKISLEIELKEIRQRLKELGEPGKSIAIKLESLKKKDKVLTDIAAIEKDIEQRSGELKRLNDSLKQYGGLEDAYRALNKRLEQLKPAYEEYQKNVEMAKAKEEWKEAYQKSLKELEELQGEYATIEEKLKVKRQAYDKNLHESIKKRYEELTRDIASIEATQKSYSRRLESVKKDIEEIQEYKKAIAELKSKREREIEYKAFIELVREKIRMAGPYVIRVFMDIISREATEMYSEIAGDLVQIKWTEDYDIVMTEDGRERPFKQLSGGEQMSAALAVRLAILKVLTGSDLVFLDEPTQNLDENRRLNLAQEITRIKDFRQMVIISHDDTFNSALENVIEIEKENGVSRVRRRIGDARPQATLT
ncbi:putative DNA repair ATPase (Rad50-like) [Methanocella conradii HZ254]|uniref:DNA repair ATPase (Rad50-like) n=1 Tax=Methanocella conradii (strain DSM 24694 / JCM 17849 / CGMCC 1.5162 / HZ254) TaxID=1041930 RepID=H8I9S4_METCZ|nr:AAA family ATPase [Methanocella conradii]AFD00525.1 putative DNA repair ATPase (Rad50-like) [Methanocella conradii HZ254]